MKRIFTILVFLFLAFSVSAQTPTLKQRTRKAVESCMLDVVGAINKGELSEAYHTLLYLQKEDPDNDAVAYYLGICQMASGQKEESVKSFEKALSIDPSNDWYRQALATAYEGVNRNADAAALYKELMEKSPVVYRTAYSLTVLGDVTLSERKDSLAEEYYNQALQMDPEYVPAIMGLSEINRFKGDFSSYFSNVKKVMDSPDLNPSWKSAYLRNLLNLIDGNFYRDWHDQLDTVVFTAAQRAPADSSVLRVAAGWSFATGRDKEGQDYLLDIANLYPEDFPSQLVRCQIVYTQGDVDSALALCDTLETLAGKDKKQLVEAYSMKGDLFHEKGDMDACFKCYKKALKLDPDYVPVLNNYAYFLCLTGKQLKKAEKMSAKTIEAEPDNATYLDTYGWILHLQGKDAEAETHFRRAMVYKGKESAEVLRHYSEVLKALGKQDMADHYYKLSLEAR